MWGIWALIFLVNSAQPDWAYDFPNRTGPDTQICQQDWIRTYILPTKQRLSILIRLSGLWKFAGLVWYSPGCKCKCFKEILGKQYKNFIIMLPQKEIPTMMSLNFSGLCCGRSKSLHKKLLLVKLVNATWRDMYTCHQAMTEVAIFTIGRSRIIG